MNRLARFFLATFIAALALGGRAEAQSTSTWANSNVAGAPVSLLDWFTGGANPQGTWTGGTPASNSATTIQFFENTTTALTNTATPSSQTVNLNNGGSAFQLGTLTLSGLASATADANLTMTLSGDALNFSGATGTINLNALNNLSSGTRTITYNVNNDIQLGTASSASALTIGGAGTGTFVLGGIISELQAGGGSLVKTGVSTVTLAGANTYTGATTITGGGLVLDYSTQNNSKLSDSAALTLGGAALVIKGGSHTETVGSTSLSAGGSTISRDGGTSVLQLNAITRASQATLAFSESSIATTDTANVNGILGGWATIGDDWAINSTNGADGAITALSSYTGALPTATGAATANYTLTGNQTQTGGVSANTVKITNSGTLTLGANSLTITAASATSLGGILYAGGGDGSYTIASTTGRVVPSSTTQELIFQTTSGTLTVNAPVGGNSTAHPVTKSGAGTLVFAAATSNNGAYRVNQGVLRLTSGTAVGNSASGSITVQSGAALELANNITTFAKPLTLSGAGVSNAGALRNLSGANTYAGPVTLGGDTRINSDAGTLTLSNAITGSGFGLTIGGAGDTSISGNIGTGAGTLTKDGAGMLTLSGTNTYSGNTTVQSGTLLFTGTQAKASGTVTAEAAGTIGLRVGGANSYTSANVAALFGNTLSGFSMNATSGVAVETTTTGTVSDALAGNRAFTKLGSAALTLSGNNTYTGATSLNAGTLSISSDANISGTNSALVFNGGALQIAGTTLTSLNPNRPTTFASGSTVSFDIASSANTFAVGQVLNQGAGGLTKAGAGTLSLDAANTYTGVTTVSQGVLLLNNANALPGGLGATGGTSNLTFNGSGASYESRHVTVLGLTSDFTRSLGAASDATAVTFAGHGGWAAFGADRTVNLGGNATPITWATANTGFNGQILVLGAAAATHTVELVNPINLGATNRTVTVTRGSANIDAKFSGNLTGSGTLILNGLTATTGNLARVQLTGSNSFGGLSIAGASLVVINDADALGTGVVGIGSLSHASGFASNSPTPLTIQNQVAVNYSNDTRHAARIGHAGYTGDLVLAGGLDWSAPLASSATIVSFEGPVTIDLTGPISGPSKNFGLSNQTTLRFMADNSAYTNNLGVNGSSGTVVLGNPMAMGSGTKSLNSYVRAEVDLTGANAFTNVSLGNLTIDGAGQSTNFGAGFTGTNSIEIAGSIDLRGHRWYINDISGGSLLLSGSVVLKPINVGKDTFYLQGSGNTTFSGNISESSLAKILITNTGITTFSGTNTYTGATTVNAGVLLLSTTAAISGTAARPYAVSAPATLAAGYALDQALLDRVATNAAGVVALGANSANNLNVTSLNSVSLGAVGSGTQAYSGTLTQTTTYRLGGGGGTLDFQSQLTGANALIVGGPTTGRGGAVILSNTDNAYTGKTTVQMGTLSIGSLANVSGGNSSLGAPTTTANGTIDLGSGTIAATLRYVGTTSSTSNRVVNLLGTTGGATLDAAGSGALVLTSALTATGVGAKTLTLTGTSTAANEIGSITGSGVSVEKTGPGLWRLTGASSFTGRFSVKDGTILAAVGTPSSGSGVFGQATSDADLPLVGDSADGATGQAAVLLESGVTVSRGLWVAASGSGASQEAILGTAATSGTATFGNGMAIRLGRDLTLRAADGGTVTFANDWEDLASGTTPAVAFNVGSAGNAGTVVFDSLLPTSITAVNVRRGTLRLGPGGSAGDETIGFGTPVTIGETGAGGTLDLNGRVQPLASLAFAGVNSVVSDGFGGGSLALYNSGSAAAVSVTGTGHTISAAMQLDDAATFTVASGGRLGISSVIANGTSGARGLTKTGAGILELAGANTFTGNTTVSQGTLVVNGSLANGALEVAAGAMLMGSGTIGGAATIFGIHSPGNSPGVETFASNLTYSGSSSEVIWELWNNTTSNSPLAYDQIVVGGTLDFADVTTLTLDFGGSGVGSVDWENSFWDSNQTWTFFSVSGTTTNFGNLSLTNSPASWLDASGQAFAASIRKDNTFSVTQDGNNVLVQYTVIIPEPTALALAGIGIAAAAWAARRRRG